MTPVVLIIRDGWGENPNANQDECNAVKLGQTPFSKELAKICPRTMLKTCGLDVGLPVGVMGNSEVGHQNIGAGRIVDQEIVRIDKALTTGELKTNEVLNKAFERAKKGGDLHLMGIASEIGVHGLLSHLYGLLALAKEAGVRNVYVHCLTDGRDSPPTSGEGYIKELEEKLKEIGVGQIATVSGRFWAMDRDKRWDRVQAAYDLFTGRKVAKTAKSALEAVTYYYQNPIDSSRRGDEFIYPTQILREDGKPVATIKNGDSVIFYNYRGDRPREITRAFIDDKFADFDRGQKLDLFYATMTEYKEGLCLNVIFRKPTPLVGLLGEVVGKAGLNQLRCSETEKFPHVTFFFNDYREAPFPGEDRILIPSPKVTTYDLQPEMSAAEVTAKSVEAILSKKYALIVMNYPNGDMVGHTGSLPAAIKATEAVDKGLQEVLKAIDATGAVGLITADHGNCEQMWDYANNCSHTSHTLYDVEILLYAGKGMSLNPVGGRLADIAPTILDIMGLPKPKEMTGGSLLVR